MSIQNNFPALKPTLLLDFANTEELDSRITFTRASTATYYGTQTAIAEQNGLLQSQDFATTWTVNNTVVASNTTIAPDGTGTADTITENTVSSFHVVSQIGLANLSNTVGTMTLSVFVKQNIGTRYFTIGLSTDITANNGSATFDLSTGTNTQTQNNGTWTSASATIVPVAQGFYRCTLTVTTDSVGAGAVRIGLNNTSTPTTANRGFGADYVGDGTSSVIVWGAQVERRSVATAYTPTTTQPIINYIPVLETAASGVARFDHNPTTFESLGLLIEESRTNLVLQSENFATTWTALGATISTNVIVAPSGTLTGDQLIEDTSVESAHRVNQNISADSTGTYTATCYVKAAGRTWARFLLDDNAGSSCLGWFNLSTGVVGSATNNGTATLASANIVSVGNGWFRCSLTGKPSTSNSATVRFQVAATINNLVSTYTGNGYSGIYIWGAQLEAGAFATSYIPTVVDQVLRATEAANMTGTNFSSWYNNAQGTIYAEGLLNNPAVTGVQSRRLAEISDGSTNNKINFGRAASASDLRVIYTVSGVNINGTNGQTASGVFPSAKTAVAYQAGNYAFSPNGASVTTSTAATVPAVNRLDIGNDVSSGATGSANGTIKKIAYYPIRVTNAQLQALTS